MTSQHYSIARRGIKNISLTDCLKIQSWNVKGIKTPGKSMRFWNEVKKATDTAFWVIQEHHLDSSSQRKQAIGEKLVFYGEGGEGFSGVLTAVDRNLEPLVVMNHASGRALAVKIKWNKLCFTIINFYGHCEAKRRAKL